MDSIYWDQVGILAVQCAGVAFILISLYRIRNIFGLGVFYVALGLFKYVHYFLAVSFSAQITDGLEVSVGSSIFFNGIIFAILFIYILDGAIQTRRVIYALIFVNFVFAVVQLLIHLGFDSAGNLNRLNIPHSFFSFKPRIFISGITLLLVDSILLIYIYENLSRICRPIILRIFCTMFIVLATHSVLFSLLAFAGTPRFMPVMIFGLYSKIIPLLVYSLLFGVYLGFFEKQKLKNRSGINGIIPVIKMVTYLEKYEELFTEKELHKQAWQDSELRFSSVIENSIEGITLVDEKGRIFVWNSSMEKITQKPASEVMGKYIWDVQFLFEAEQDSHERKKQIENSIKKLLKTGEAPFLQIPMEREYTRQDGSRVVMNARMNTVRTNKGFILVSITNDVTNEKNALEELKQNELKFRTIFEESTDGIALLDINSNFLDANQKLCKMLDYSKEELMSINLAELFHPDDVKEKNREKDVANLLAGKTVGGNYRFIKQGNQIIFVEVRTKMLDENRFLSVVRDITKQKKAEDELKVSRQRLIDAQHLAQIGDFYWHVKTNEVTVSEGLYRLLKYPQNKVFTYEELNTDIHYKEDQEKINAWISDCIQSGKTKLTPLEYRLVCKDGDIIYVHTEGNLNFENGELVSVFGMCQNITEKIKAHRQLQQSETKYREIIELAVDGILLGESGGKIIGGNNKMLELSKRTKENLIGQNINILFEQKELEEKELRYDLLHEGKTVIVERTIVQPGGKKVPVEMHTKMMPDGSYQSIFRDISERKKAIEEIKNLNSRLLKAEEIAGLGFIEWDLKTNRFFVSPEIKKIYEIPEHTENLRAFIEKTTHPNDKEFLSEQYKSAIEGKKRYHVDHRLLLPPGKIKWVSIHGEIICDDKDNAVLMVGTVLNVTRQKMAIEKLTESENKFRTAFTTSPDSININRLEDGLYIEVNNGFTELTGFTREETVGKTSAEIDIWENTDDRKKLVAELQQKGKAENMEFRFKMKEGSIKSALMSANIISINQVPHILSITRDITDRIQVQKELESFASRIGLLHTLDREILAANSTDDVAYIALNELQKNIPFEMALVVLYKPENNVAIPIAAVPDDFKKEIINSELELDTYEIIDLEHLKNNEVIIFNDLNKFETKSVRVKKMIKKGQNAIIMAPLIAENELVGIISLSAPTSSVFSNDNIDVIKEVASQLAVSIRQWNLRNEVAEHTQLLESKVAERTGQLEHSNRELRDFAQIVSHDLKAPLRSISQLSYWISQDYADKIDKEGQEQLKMLIGRVQRLDKLIDGILQYSKVGKMREKEKHIDFNVLLEEIISSLDIPKHITITIENKLPEYNGDPVRFAQMFQNLIDNAIKYNDKQKGYVKIGCQLKNNYWEFYVSDNGVGIEKNYFDRIFQIFQRLISRDEMEGTGIGLTLVKRIIQIYGGEIWLDSVVGEGTTFYFTLPLQKITT